MYDMPIAIDNSFYDLFVLPEHNYPKVYFHIHTVANNRWYVQLITDYVNHCSYIFLQKGIRNRDQGNCHCCNTTNVGIELSPFDKTSVHLFITWSFA